MRQSAPPEYYGRQYLGEDAYVGAHFDSWSSSGKRAGEADRFTANDLVAAGVPVSAGPTEGGAAIPDTDAEALNAPLRAVDPDRDRARRTGPARSGVARLGPGNCPAGAACDRPDEGDEVDRPQTSPAVRIFGFGGQPGPGHPSEHL